MVEQDLDGQRFTPEEARAMREMADDPSVREEFADARRRNRARWRESGYPEAWAAWLAKMQAEAGHPMKPRRPMVGDQWVL